MWKKIRLYYVTLRAFIDVLMSEKSGVLIVYDPRKRRTDIYLHNLDTEGGRNLTLIGLSGLNDRLAREKVIHNEFIVHLN